MKKKIYVFDGILLVDKVYLNNNVPDFNLHSTDNQSLANSSFILYHSSFLIRL